LLEKLTQRIGEIISVLGSKAEEAKNAAEANGNNVNLSSDPASPE
jgi:hypothetical protein